MIRGRSTDQRIIDQLLADRALQGLTDAEERLLERLLAEQPDARLDELDRIVALLDVFFAQRELEPAPEHVRDRLLHMSWQPQPRHS